MKLRFLISVMICVGLIAESAKAAYTHLSSEIVALDAISGYVTVRVYANFSNSSDQLTGMYGNGGSPFHLDIINGQLYQNPFGGGNALSIDPDFYPFVPELAYDSWITIGDEDQVANLMSSIGVNYDNFEAGGDMIINDPAGAGLFVGAGSAQCFPMSGRVLIAQLTINGDVNITCNIQWQDEFGSLNEIVGQSLYINGGVPGCNDPLALNFDQNASYDDGSCSYAPPGYSGLIYEEIGQNLVEGYNTYRIYASFTYPTEQLAAVFGQDVTPLSIATSGQFFQHPAGALTSDGIDPDMFALAPGLEYDTWVTIGRDSGPNEVSTINVDGSTFEGGGTLTITDADGGAWYVLPGVEPLSFPDDQGRVLIAQLTASGDISIALNIQYRSSDGTSHQELAQTLMIPFVQSTCPGDYTADGLVGSADLLIFLAGFGCSSSCETDLTGDDQTGTADLLLFLSYFGSSCL